jgi:hypothetical protein
MRDPTHSKSETNGVFAFLRRIFQNRSTPPPTKQAEPAAAPNAPVTLKRAERDPAKSRHVFRFVLKPPDPKNPPPPNHIQVVAEAYYKDSPDGRRTYGIDLHSGMTVLDMLEAEAAVFWKELFDGGTCTEEQALAWLVAARRLAGPEYLRELPATEFEETHLFRGLSKLAVHVMLRCDNPPDSFITLFEAQFASEESRRRRARDIADSARFASVLQSGVLSEQFVAFIRKSAGLDANPNTRNG